MCPLFPFKIYFDASYLAPMYYISVINVLVVHAYSVGSTKECILLSSFQRILDDSC